MFPGRSSLTTGPKKNGKTGLGEGQVLTRSFPTCRAAALPRTSRWNDYFLDFANARFWLRIQSIAQQVAEGK